MHENISKQLYLICFPGVAWGLPPASAYLLDLLGGAQCSQLTSFALNSAHWVVKRDPEPCPWNLDLTVARKGCRGCPRDHICCLSDGGEVCIPPLFQKPGFCPHRHWDFEHCGDLCFCDGDCPNKEKCCSTGCGHMCMAPVLDDCPRHLNLALARKGCKDCPRDHICCVCLGEEVCVPPVSKKPGVCPRRCLDFGNCAESCSCDSDCSDHEKCCSNGCGHECMPAVIEYCPWCHNHVPSPKGCSNFPRDHKDEKPGVCPRKRPDFGHCTKFCSCDSDCPKNEKCCPTKCGHECIAPVLVKPGHCPRSRQTSKRCAEFCSNDSDCPDNDKCCSNGCGRECMEPQIVKSGVCPRRRLGYGRCAEFCSNDGDCPDKEKCCSNGCGHECMAPYVVKPGRCPLPDTTPMCAEYCYHDGQCPGEQKCCRTTCGHACTEPC
ncbi:keratin-associated protein 5-1-like [Archocentrus centrarchus]|uniref:keratin-associated protein 5-1-like n=1 Tax=Archocentrus centrarchus TaxID=63155 RepID=UPI0011EA27B4|nr:keratin-associated protein 5-1-like [Archocentrus centrarchus]